MIELYSTNIASTNGMTVPWNGKAAQAGASATLNSDGETISLNRVGTYEVTVNGFGSTTEAGTFGFQLNGNNGAIVRSAASETTTAAGVGSVSFTTLVVVTSSTYGNTAEITVTYTGGAGTISLANIVVKKVL